MKIFLLFVTMIAVSACSGLVSGKQFPLAAADPIAVRECRLVDTYPGPYGYRFWGPPPVLADFRYRTALQAQEKGATHIYWREEAMGYYGESRIVGYAFDCRGVAMPRYADDASSY